MATYCIRVAPASLTLARLDAGEDGAATSEPDEEEHGLEDQRALVVIELKFLRVMAKQAAEHVDHKEHRQDEVQAGSAEAVPETLGVRLIWTDRRYVSVHRCEGRNELSQGR